MDIKNQINKKLFNSIRSASDSNYNYTNNSGTENESTEICELCKAWEECSATITGQHYTVHSGANSGCFIRVS
jgi:hypothetical protein